MELRWELIILAGELWALSPVMSVLGLRSRPSKQGVLQESWCPPGGSHDALCSLGPHIHGLLPQSLGGVRRAGPLNLLAVGLSSLLQVLP